MSYTFATAQDSNHDNSTGLDVIIDQIKVTDDKQVKITWAILKGLSDESLVLNENGKIDIRPVSKKLAERGLDGSTSTVSRVDTIRRAIVRVEGIETADEKTFKSTVKALAKIMRESSQKALDSAGEALGTGITVDALKDAVEAQRAAGKAVGETATTDEPDTDDSGAGEPVTEDAPREANPVEVYLSQARTSALIDELISRVKSGKLSAETMAEVEAFAAYVSELEQVAA